MVDTDKLRRAIRTFTNNSRPHSTNPADLCTVQDMNNLVNEISKVLKKFVDELESEQ